MRNTRQLHFLLHIASCTTNSMIHTHSEPSSGDFDITDKLSAISCATGILASVDSICLFLHCLVSRAPFLSLSAHLFVHVIRSMTNSRSLRCIEFVSFLFTLSQPHLIVSHSIVLAPFFRASLFSQTLIAG